MVRVDDEYGTLDGRAGGCHGESMFVIYLITAWVLWRVFYWKCPYAVAFAIVATAVQWMVAILLDSTLLSIAVVFVAIVVAVKVLDRDSLHRMTHAHRRDGDYMYRVDVDEDAWRERDNWPPHYR